jgi:riboflavin synthase alpha subunit
MNGKSVGVISLCVTVALVFASAFIQLGAAQDTIDSTQIAVVKHEDRIDSLEQCNART